MPSQSSISIKNLQKAPGQLLRRAHQISVAIASQQLVPFNMTIVQYASLVAIREQPGLDATRLSALISFDRPTLTGVIDRLEAKGWLVRMPDPQDRRTRLLHLTPEGATAVAQADEVARKIHNTVLEPLPPEERKLFADLLEKLVDLHTRDMPAETRSLLGKEAP